MVDPNSCFQVTVLPNGRHNLFQLERSFQGMKAVLNTYHQVIQPDFLTSASEWMSTGMQLNLLLDSSFTM